MTNTFANKPHTQPRNNKFIYIYIVDVFDEGVARQSSMASQTFNGGRMSQYTSGVLRRQNDRERARAA